MTMASEAKAASLDGRRGSNASVSLNNNNGIQCDDDTHEVVGYQEPDIECQCQYPADDETLRRVLANDPSIAGLYLGLVLPDNDWVDRSEQLCEAIIKSVHLCKLNICNNLSPLMSTDVLKSLCRAISLNRSIQHLKMSYFDLTDVDIFPILSPFFEFNHNLRCIDISHAKNFPEKIPSFISTVLQSGSSRLERIVLWSNNIGDDHAANLLNAIDSSSGLSHLSDLWLGCNSIGREGCQALGDLLENPQSKIQRLKLCGNQFDDECMGILACALVKNSTMKELDLGSQKSVTPTGWCTFSSILLSNPNCSLTTINLADNLIGDEGAISLGNSMLTTGHLKRKGVYLDLTLSKSITMAGWQGFSTCLSNNGSALIGLNLYMCNISDEMAAVIIGATVESSSLKSLKMPMIESMTAAGWIQCFRLLAESDEFTLDEFDISDNYIDDVGAAILFNLLANSTLKTLGIASNISITPAGWIACFQSLVDSDTTVKTLWLDGNNIDYEGAVLLSDLLPSFGTTHLDIHGNLLLSANGWSLFADVLLPETGSELNHLCIGNDDGNDIDDHVVTRFASALARNTSLQTLELYGVAISDRGWSALANTLCDNSSIASICNSNHTLRACWLYSDEGLPRGLFSSLLQVNSIKDKADMLRTKIIMHYFSDVDNIGQVFAHVPVTTLPDAIAWIGRDRLGYSMMCHLLRSFPSMLR